MQDTSTSTVVVNRSHAFGDGINLTGITDNLASTRSETYIYRPTNRLQEGDGIWGTLTWSYDSVGNRSSEVLTSGSTTTSTYNYPTGSNKLSSVTQGATMVRTFTHDGAGNVTADKGACWLVKAAETQDFTNGTSYFAESLCTTLEAIMDRDIAVRIDGMLMGVRGNLDGIAHYMKNNLSDQEFSNLVLLIGKSMSALVDISTHLHASFPDIVPKELMPPTK